MKPFRPLRLLVLLAALALPGCLVVTCGSATPANSAVTT